MRPKLTPALFEQAPWEWQPTPEGYLVVLRRLEEQGRVEIRPRGAKDTIGRPLGWEWRRLCAVQRRKAS